MIESRWSAAGCLQSTVLLDRLQAVREETLDDPKRAGDLAAPLYAALASQITGRGRQSRIPAMCSAAIRNAINAATGLIATNLGWKSALTVLAGPPVFGALYAFVPSVIGADRL